MKERQTIPHAALALLLVTAACAGEPENRGRDLYISSCAPCHGDKADGQGPRAAVLDPKPRDYTDPEWRRQATLESVLTALREGVPGSAMPSWEILSESDLEAVARYVLEISDPDGAFADTTDSDPGGSKSLD